MTRGKAKISTEIEEKIYELYDQNMKTKDIANELNVGLSTVQRYTARYKKELEEAEKILNGALGEDKEDKENKQSNKVEELEKIIQEQEKQIKMIENTADNFFNEISEKNEQLGFLQIENNNIKKEIKKLQIKVDELKKENEVLKKDNIDWQNILRIENEMIANRDKEVLKYKKYKKLFKSAIKLIKGLV